MRACATPGKTTYYNGEYLLMADYDGEFNDTNSGYMTQDGKMYHFVYSGDLNNPISKKTFSMNTTVSNYYVALDDLLLE